MNSQFEHFFTFEDKNGLHSLREALDLVIRQPDSKHRLYRRTRVGIESFADSEHRIRCLFPNLVRELM